MTESEELLVLVDTNDNEAGVMPKMQAHQQGMLHRAISVFVFDGQGRVLLQKRHKDKYHSQSQWANTTCSHPRPGEMPFTAARRRLQEEMGFDCTLRFLFKLIYRHDVGNDLIEHELVHAFAGHYNGPIRPNPLEAEGFQWMSLDALVSDAKKQPELYAPWLRIYLDKHEEDLRAAART